MTKILPRDCKHPYQDEMYGEGNRVHNYSPGSSKTAGNKQAGWACTVCGDKKFPEKEGSK